MSITKNPSPASRNLNEGYKVSANADTTELLFLKVDTKNNLYGEMEELVNICK